MSSLKFTTILINNFFSGWRTDGYVRLLKAALHRGAIRGMVGWDWVERPDVGLERSIWPKLQLTIYPKKSPICNQNFKNCP